MEPSGNSVAAILRVFQEHGVNAVVIGGVAAIAMGVPYTTLDVDLCYDTGADNVPRLLDTLRAMNARLRVARMTDDEARALPFTLDAKTLSDNDVLTLRTDLGDLDLLRSIPGVGGYLAVQQASVEADIFGVRFLVLDLPALIINKRATATPKDIATLPLIEATLRSRELEEP